MRRWSACLLLVTPFILAIPVRQLDAQNDGQAKSDVRLALLVVFDQLTHDLLERCEPLFEEGGFKRLKKEGAWFTKCNYPYAVTLTAPGHTALATGATPAQHGIIANKWYDPAVGNEGKEEESTTPPRAVEHLGAGPHRRNPRVETVGDVLLRFLGRIFSLAIKERSAILMAPGKAQAVYWFDNGKNKGTTPGFRSSRYYSGGEPDPRWVRDFNDPKNLDRWWGTAWCRLHKYDYAPFAGGIDDFPGEGTGYDQGRTFPHPFKEFSGEDKHKYYDAITLSPMGNELLWEFAKLAIEHDKLGQSAAPDLLCLGFSCNDMIGHCYGPNSWESLDATLRTDRLVRAMLDYLDAKIGKDKYVMVVSADHGICPLVEHSRTVKKLPVTQLPPDLLTGQLNQHLSDTFLKGVPANWQKAKTSNPFIYLNRELLKALGLEQAKVEQAAAEWLCKQPGIQSAYTRSQLVHKKPPLDEIGKMVERSFDPKSEVDVMVVVKPYHLFHIDLKKNETFRTTHGSPHPYDTHVPLIVHGTRVQAGVRADPVTPLAAAPILARALGLPPPNHAQDPLPANLFK